MQTNVYVGRQYSVTVMSRIVSITPAASTACRYTLIIQQTVSVGQAGLLTGHVLFLNLLDVLTVTYMYLASHLTFTLFIREHHLQDSCCNLD